MSCPAKAKNPRDRGLIDVFNWLARPRLPAFLEEYKNIKIDLRALTGRPEHPDPDVEIWIAFGPYAAGLKAQRLFGEELTPVATPALAAS